jgi:hypothetical protein
MLINLMVNAYTSRVASVAGLRQELAPFASQFREIWVSVDAGGPSLAALMNTNVGLLTYLRLDQGDPGFSSRNPMYDESEATLGGLVKNTSSSGSMRWTASIVPAASCIRGADNSPAASNLVRPPRNDNVQAGTSTSRWPPPRRRRTRRWRQPRGRTASRFCTNWGTARKCAHA